jgi:hypothetical protein
MITLTNSGCIPEELFSQKGSTAVDAKFNKTLMADLSRQARQPMTGISANAAYCYNRVNHEVMSLVWLILLNGHVPAIVAALICLQTMIFFSTYSLQRIQNLFWQSQSSPYIMGLGQGSRAVPSSWIQLSLVMVNVFKQLG